MIAGLVVAAVLLVLILTAAAQAQQQACADRDVLAARLESRYGEIPFATGLSDTGNLVELFVAPNGTWTLVVVRPGGIACLMAAGEAFTPGFTPSAPPPAPSARPAIDGPTL